MAASIQNARADRGPNQNIAWRTGRGAVPENEIDSSQVHGEPGTGFEERGDLGEEVCGNCEFFKNDSCGQKTMMARSKHPRTKDGRVQVGDGDCCAYVKRVGRPEYGGKHSLLKSEIRR